MCVYRSFVEYIQSLMDENQPNQEDRPRSLDLKMLEKINLNYFPPQRTHYLAYALQYGLKLPSVKIMDRCQARNKKKAGNEKADKLLGRDRNLKMLKKIYKTFCLPNRFGIKPSQMNRLIGVRKRKGAVRVIRKEQVYRKGRVYPPRKPVSLPKEVQRKARIGKAPKARKGVFTIRSPEVICLKAQRARFCQEIEIYRKTFKVPKQEKSEYYSRKKGKQKERRKQKHELIRNNRKALVQIFGDVIFKSGWPISRKQIKLALGLKEPEHDQESFLSEFMNMAARSPSKGSSKGSSQSGVVRMAAGQNESSRMLRKGKPSKPFENMVPKSYQVIKPHDSRQDPVYLKLSEFPSIYEENKQAKKKR